MTGTLERALAPLMTIGGFCNLGMFEYPVGQLRELKTCLRELAIVDHTLEVHGTPKEYQRLRNWIIRIIIGWIVYVFYQFTYYSFNISFIYYINNELNFILFVVMMFTMLLNNYPSNVITLSALISAAILGLVLYMCIHLLCKLFLLTLCVKIFTV
ncbi:hypothetical protein ALC57_09071 [Trachymyrmex cornetzi]|uniref:Uncharacterized protein n=1 Tax=Trachymyrmex cornetzi TaxID=471704 RepID=A0A151J5V8_9HYME|nr:hypothetical protein ALC57_09071 [Trachymyrmex cornetzi]